jgi:hypothetical protein
MLTRILFLATLVLSGTVFLTGAWSGSFTPAPPVSEVSFAPQTVPLDADIVGSGVNADGLLAKAMEKLAPQRTAWLKTKIRQTVNDGDTSFRAEGALQRGPNHCVRLEMDVVRDGACGHMVIVSDGELLAQVRRAGRMTPIARLERLPAASAEKSEADAAACEALLAAKGCGGPLALLGQFRRRLKNGKLQTGLLDGQPVIQIKGNLDPAAPKTPAQVGYAYLDAKTLWPHRLEWWNEDNAHAPRPIVQIEFLEPEINRELSLEECARVFSYQPGGNEKVSSK